MTLTSKPAPGHRVLIEAELVSDRKSSAVEGGPQMDYFLVKVRGQNQNIPVLADSVRDFEPANFVLTDVDFDVSRTTIAKSIRKARQDANLSQHQLSELIGVSQNAISQWETGVCVPRFHMIPTLVKALGIGVQDLYGDLL